MDLDHYRERMAAAHQQFQDGVVQMLKGYGQTQTVMTDLLRAVETGFAELKQSHTDLKESNDALRTLILEQGQQLRALRDRGERRARRRRMITNLKYILNAAGEPERCDDTVTWGLWFEAASRTGARVVAKDRDEGPGAADVEVSTVFLGLDHNFSDVGPPVLWESLVFGGPLDQEMQRYTSRAAALAGHQALCARVFPGRCGPNAGPQGLK